jgi:hypothetical protein
VNETSRKFTAIIAFAMLLSVSTFLAACVLAGASEKLYGDRGVGWLYLTFLRNSDEIRMAFSAPIVIIASGVTILGSASSNKWLAYLDSLLAVLGILLCFVLFIMLHDEDGFARPLWYNSVPKTSPEQIVDGTVKLIGYLVAWYGSLLATQLGIPQKVAGGARSGFMVLSKKLGVNIGNP